MADTEKQGAMVLHEEGMTAPTLPPPPTSAPSLFVVLKQVHPGDVRTDKGSLLAISEANNMIKSTISSAVTGIHPTSSTPHSDTTTHPESMPADARCKGITVTLDNNSMWNEFCRCKTEMILTKQGRRMFPYCRFRLSGMEPFQSYTLAMDIVPVDNHRYKWNGKGWETNGKADPHVTRLFIHPESPATGLHWMQYPVSFYRLKLCNNILDQEGHIILHSMHRYLPRLHIIPADKATEDISIDRPDVITLSFSQTEFFAVTAYQNLCITQLKIDYNPFAKGFREDAVNARSTKAKNGVSIEEAENEPKQSKETTLINLKTLFMKRSAAAKVNKDQNTPSPTNGEKIVVNSDAPIVDRDKSTKKRPLPGAFSDFLKGAHVKVKRLSLENIQKNGIVVQSATACTSGKQDVVTAISSKPEHLLQAGETVISEIHPYKNTDKSLKTELITVDENKMVVEEHKDDKITLLSSDQIVQSSDEKGKENLSSLNTEVKPESKTKKILPHKRPEPVPLPLLAQFLKQRKSKTRSTTPKPEAPSPNLDSKPHLTFESSPDLVSSTPSANTHIDSQPSLTSLPQTDVSLSTVDANNTTSMSTTSLSSSLIEDPFILVGTQKPLRFSPSPPASDPFLVHNTTSPAKLNHDPALDSLSDIGQGLDGTLRSQSDISSVSPCNDTDLSTTPAVNTDVAITSDTPTDVTSHPVCDAPSNKNSEIFLNQEHSPRPQVVEIESVSDCLVESSNDLCPELFEQDIPPHSLSTHDDSHSLPLDDPSSPAFLLSSPAASSPDPFPPDLFCDRPVPPRKTLDPFPERLLDCTALPSSELFTLGLFSDMPKKGLEGGILQGSIDLLSPSVQNRSDLSSESLDLFSQTPCSDKAVNDIQTANNCQITVHEPTKQTSHESTLNKSNKKHKKIGKLKHGEDDVVFEGSVPAPLQPSLEDVEGQLFVSFMSKAALEIHLGDDAKIEVAQKTLANSDGDNRNRGIEEKIEVLEKNLLHDLKIMKHRQVIHPVLQEVGLKLNLLDHTLAIDLQYLGVQLPIPPIPIPLPIPEESSASSQVQFISRTGKTTDFTKIKGWRDKFAGSRSLSDGGSSIDTGQNNLSAFCSDMLDEYLASEGKLIDERAANLSQTDSTPVAYQLPTKSTSYVRTLDSVLKKQVPPSLSTTSKQPSPTSIKVKQMLKPEVGRKSERHLKRLKSAIGKHSLSTDKPVSREERVNMNFKKAQQIKICNIRNESKSLGAEKLIVETPAAVVSEKTPSVEVSASISASYTGGRGPGLPKTLVKLMDVEDGAVWEGKHRTCITEERAAIALTALVTAKGITKGNPDAMRIIKRRAPPCLNIFCRLGCVCASLLHRRRHHHCGKPECMLGCSCLRRKVVALKSPSREDRTTEEPEPQGLSEEDKAKWRKNKKRKTYILTDPQAAPEPAKRVNTLWDQKRRDFDSEVIFCPPPSRVPSQSFLSEELQHDLESFFSPPKQKMVVERNLNRIEENNNIDGNLTCSRARPFHWKCHDKPKTPIDQHHISQVSTQDIEEGELSPLNLSGPVKRLEIISECSWSSIESRNSVMETVCKHMAQDCLIDPFWSGKYYIQPITKIVEETEGGCVQTYRVNISQPMEKEKEDENIMQSDVQTESKQPVEKIEVKGLPFLSRCSPAGLLKAEIKAPDAPGQIMVNGKAYPQAKLELGKMGALHPANRLAAYITGRICPVSQSGSNAVTTATIAAVPVTSVATVTSVTSTSSTITSPIKTTVTKPPVGQVFTKFMVNHINSEKLPGISTSRSQSLPPKIIIPPSLAGAPAVSRSPLKAGLATQVSKPSDSPGSIAFPTVSKVTILNKPPGLPLGASNITPIPVSLSGSSTSGKKILITVVSRSTGVTSIEPQVVKPVMQVCSPPVTGQKMMLQVVKTADGNTLYRNPSGQLVRLVPLSQFKSLKPSLLPRGPTTMFRLPAPNAVSLNKPQSGSTSTVSSSNPTSLTQTIPTITVPAPTSVSGKPLTLTTSKSVSFSSLPPTMKVTPNFLGQSGTCTLRILPPNHVKDTGITTPTSSPSLSQPGFTLLKPTKAYETIVSVSSDSKKVQTLLDLSKRSKMVSSKQNSCYDSKISESLAATTFPKPTQCSGDTSSPSNKELGELEHSSLAANPSVKETDLKDGGINSDVTELTDDSDLYSEDDQDDTNSDSDKEEHRTVEDKDGLDSEKKDPAEVVVDIETFEESTEKINIALLRESAKKENLPQSQQDVDDDNDKKFKKVQQERMRRSTLREHFSKLHLALEKRSKNGSNMSILTLAQEEIKSLIRKEEKLVKKRDKLKVEIEQNIELLSILSDKSVESISQKLNEIITKQKALEAQSEVRQMNSQLMQTTPNPKDNHSPKCIDSSSKLKDSALQNEIKDASELIESPSKPIDLSLKKQRSLETSKSILEVDSKPKEPDDGKNTPTAPVKETSNVSKSGQPVTYTTNLNSVPVTIPIKHSLMPKEGMRPNILSRSEAVPVSPVKEPLETNVCIPQVIPLVNTMVPCNQIITLNKPLQPIGITSLGPQSTTPGVASVSISVPTMPQPLGRESPLPMLQPQIIDITDNPVNINTQVEPVNLPNITNVISLDPPVNNLVLPQQVELDEIEAESSVQTQPIFIPPPAPVEYQQKPQPHVESQPKQSVGDVPTTSVASSNQDGLDKKSHEDSSDPEDENLMSLLDELVLLSQQLSNGSPEPTNEEQNVTAPTEKSSQPEPQVDTGRDDDRELSPLFLTLDEDLMSPECSKDEIDDIPPKVDDLVKVIFGSDSPSVSSESAVATSTNVQSPQPPTSDALTPPPLLHMKAACGPVSSHPASEGANVAWRPMPKLVPLGLKALKSDSEVQDVQQPHT